MMPAVYIVGKDAETSDELRFSLRSLSMFGRDVIDRVILVGDVLPSWSHGVDFIHCPDPLIYAKEGNIASKLFTACAHINEPFMMMHDDHFILTPLTEPPVWEYDGILDPEACISPIYGQYVANTKRFLRQYGKTICNYDVHAPIVIEPEQFFRIWRVAYRGWTTEDPNHTLLTKSVYCNWWAYRKAKRRSSDLKVRGAFDAKALNGRWCFSSGEPLHPTVKAFLAQQYPSPGQWEAQ